MTSERKKELFLRKWAACPHSRQVEIAAEFLKKTRNDTMIRAGGVTWTINCPNPRDRSCR